MAGMTPFLLFCEHPTLKYDTKPQDFLAVLLSLILDLHPHYLILCVLLIADMG